MNIGFSKFLDSRFLSIKILFDEIFDRKVNILIEIVYTIYIAQELYGPSENLGGRKKALIFFTLQYTKSNTTITPVKLTCVCKRAVWEKKENRENNFCSNAISGSIALKRAPLCFFLWSPFLYSSFLFTFTRLRWVVCAAHKPTITSQLL